ncbi:MAG: carboxymuconolactone decarboxylase family protein [Ginsengibacter sp.]
MEQRTNIAEMLPSSYKAMYDLSITVNKSSLTPVQKELIKIRASQVNGCGYCLDMHTSVALNSGEKKERIFLLDAWKESDLFSEKEKAMLSIVEEVTLIHEKGVSDATYRRVQNFFNEEEIAEIIMTTVVINAWNRIAISTNLPF